MHQNQRPEPPATTLRQPLATALPLGEGLVLAVILFIVLALA